jgi:phage terminase large subunit-like protein
MSRSQLLTLDPRSQLPLSGPNVFPQPTLLHLPPEPADWSYSDIAVEWAESVGYVLDPWQKWLVRWAFARNVDHLWAARDMGVEVCRQNGKNIWLEVVELASLLLFGDKLITHSAHRADTSHEHFLSLQTMIRDVSDELMSYMPSRHNQGFITTNGNESIAFNNGARLLFKARAKSAGRGPRPQKLVLDEALVLVPSQIGTVAPSISAQPNPQILFASSAPLSDSTMLHNLRERAELNDTDDEYFYAAWNNDPEVEIGDIEAYHRVNPSLGRGRLTVRSLEANRKLMTEADFRREHMGVPDESIIDSDPTIPADMWANLGVKTSEIVASRAWALSVSADRGWATLGVAGRREDQLFSVEWKTRKPGTGWIVAEVVAAYAVLDLPIRIFRSGPEGSFIDRLIDQGVEVEEVSTNDVAQATSTFIDLVREGNLRHLGQQTLADQIAAATLRISPDASQIWSHRRSDEPIDALMAVTVALGGAFAAKVEDDGEWFSY